MILDADIDLMLADCGDTFTVGDTTQPCLLTMHDEVAGIEAGFGGQIVAVGTALIRTSAFPDLATNNSVTVKSSDSDISVDYRVAQMVRVQDGRMTQVLLGVD